MKCDKCNQLGETPIFLKLLEETLKKQGKIAVRYYHNKGHKLV